MTSINEIIEKSLMGKKVKIKPFGGGTFTEYQKQRFAEQNITTIDDKYIIGTVDRIGFEEIDYESDAKIIFIDGCAVWLEYNTRFEIID